MIVLDSNVLIYLAQGSLPKQLLAEQTIAHASISRIETLGYHALPASELILLTELFNLSHELPLTDGVIGRATQLRQLRPMSLGDAIIAATALEHSAPLWTTNTDDFHHVHGLNVVNPHAIKY